jgi:hypothetical protein
MIIVDKIVEIKTSKTSFIYLDETSEGIFRICYTSGNANIVKKLRDDGIIVKETIKNED